MENYHIFNINKLKKENPDDITTPRYTSTDHIDHYPSSTHNK